MRSLELAPFDTETRIWWAILQPNQENSSIRTACYTSELASARVQSRVAKAAGGGELSPAFTFGGRDRGVFLSNAGRVLDEPHPPKKNTGSGSGFLCSHATFASFAASFAKRMIPSMKDFIGFPADSPLFGWACRSLKVTRPFESVHSAWWNVIWSPQRESRSITELCFFGWKPAGLQ